jgi:hypothetical protein
MGLDLSPQNWFWPKNRIEYSFSSDLPVIAIQVGASHIKKTVRPEVWANLISNSVIREKFQFVLLGGPDDLDSARQILSSNTSSKVMNLVGSHSFIEVAEWLRGSQALIAADSSLVHLASLVGTPTLQITHDANCFWETGPRAQGSFVLEFLDSEQVSSGQVALAIQRMLPGHFATDGLSFMGCRLYKSILGTPSYEWIEGEPVPLAQDFSWSLIRAIYQGEKLPEVTAAETAQALLHLLEVNSLILDLLERVTTPDSLQKYAPLLNQTEEVIQTLASLAVEIRPLISWYQTQKIRIGPGDFEEVLQRTLQIHQDLSHFLLLFAGNDELTADASLTANG